MRISETFHVRGVRRASLIDVLVERMRESGWARCAVDPAEGPKRELLVRPDGKWLTVADATAHGSASARKATPDSRVDSWGKHVSRALGRSVLAIRMQEETQPTLRATRFRDGSARGVLSLMKDAYRANGLPHAPAKILVTWLPRAERDAILASGIALVEPGRMVGRGRSRRRVPPQVTGDAELDALLDGFDDADRVESEVAGEDFTVWVDELVALRALGAAVGMMNPFLYPSATADGDEKLVFRR